MTILLWQKSLPQVVRQIVQRDNGAWFDPSDMSTLYQDAAGTVPVTAVGQPVGKILDKSGNGNHATQPITASRPTLSARYNLLTKTEDFSDAAWVKSGITLSQALGPNGVTGAYKITEDLTTGNHRLSQAVSSSASSYIVYIKNDGANYCIVGWRSNSDIRYDAVRYNLLTKSKIVVQNGSGLYVSDSIVDIGDGWLKITVTLKSAAQFHVACANPTKDPSYLVAYTGDGVSGLIVYHPQVSPSVITPYQRVNTATDYDTDERYFPKYLKFDGIDDYLTLGDVFDIGINGVSISASVILFSSTKSPIAGKSWTAAAGGRYFLGAEPNVFLFASHNNTPPVSIAYSQSKGESVVLSAKLGPHGNRRLSLYKNANLLSTVNTSLTTASYDTTAPFWIGAYPNSTGTTPAYGYLEGSIYGLIITKSALTDAQRIKCERFLAQKSGVML